jgi:hypothetical protein
VVEDAYDARKVRLARIDDLEFPHARLHRGCSLLSQRAFACQRFSMRNLD